MCENKLLVFCQILSPSGLLCCQSSSRWLQLFNLFIFNSPFILISVRSLHNHHVSIFNENWKFPVFSKKKKKKEAEKGNCLARMWLLVWTPALHYVVMNVYYFFLIALTKALYRGPVQLLFECQMVFCLTSLYTKEQNIPTGWSRSWWGPQCFQSLTWYACSRHLIHKCDCSLDQSRLSGESWQCV